MKTHPGQIELGLSILKIPRHCII